MTDEEIKDYFYAETRDFTIKSINKLDSDYSYLWHIDSYLIKTNEGYDFYIFVGDTIPTNIYPVLNNEKLEEVLYKHIGFMASYCSYSTGRNFIIDFINEYSIFPILDRDIKRIEKELKLGLTSSQLSGIANEIRRSYISLSHYLVYRLNTNNSQIKMDDFCSNLQEFLLKILPGSSSETRRNTINGIARKGWDLNCSLIHKDSTAFFDVCISLNIFKLLVSIINDVIVGNNMPFNKIKCPNCHSENYTLFFNENSKEYEYVCKDCKTHYSVDINQIVKKFD